MRESVGGRRVNGKQYYVFLVFAATVRIEGNILPWIYVVQIYFH